jgi:hypothetical protein
MRKSSKKFFKSPSNVLIGNNQNNQAINLADRITFSNFNKDGQFVAFNLEQQQ